MSKKYTCAGMKCGGRVKGYASGGSVDGGSGGGGGMGGGGWSDDGGYASKYEGRPLTGGAPKVSPLGGRMFGSDRVPKFTDTDMTASKRR